MEEGWCWGWDPRATVMRRGGGEGVWGRHPMTSQTKVAPTLDRHECLAVGLRVKSHSPPGQGLVTACPWPHTTCSPRLCLGKDAVSSKGTPKAQPRLSGGISVGL